MTDPRTDISRGAAWIAERRLARRDIADMPAHYLKEIEHFFGIYKDLEGKRVEIQGWEKSEAAFKVIQRSIERYADVYLKG